MKKIQLKRKSKQTAEQPAKSITNQTVAEHREQILAGGRRFKYPHQYVRHKLVINAVIIAALAAVLFSIFSWWRLYQAHDTSEFMYRLTSIIPAPVASVDGENVRYSDYLVRYRAVEKWLRDDGRINLSGKDGERQLNFYKRSVLSEVERDAYASKIAKETKVSVSDDTVQQTIDSSRQTANGTISQEVFDISTQDTLGFSKGEYREVIRQGLLRRAVAYAIDSQAKRTSDQVSSYLAKNKKKQLQEAAKILEKQGLDVTYGASGDVPLTNQDGGRPQLAATLRPGQLSSVHKTATSGGYYYSYIRLLKKTSRSIDYEYIAVPVRQFDEQFRAIKVGGKLQEYISLPDAQPENFKE